MHYLEKFYKEINNVAQDGKSDPILAYLTKIFIFGFPTLPIFREAYHKGKLNNLTIEKTEDEFAANSSLIFIRPRLKQPLPLNTRQELILKELASRLPHYSFTDDGRLEYHLSFRDSYLTVRGFFRPHLNCLVEELGGITDKYLDRKIVGANTISLEKK